MFLNTQFTSTRRAFCKYIGAAAASIFVGEANTFSVHAASHQEGQSRQSPGAGINVLLVHGAFVDASSWIGVIPLLQAQGYNVLAVRSEEHTSELQSRPHLVCRLLLEKKKKKKLRTRDVYNIT